MAVTFEYYLSDYGGSLIPEPEFAFLSRAALDMCSLVCGRIPDEDGDIMTAVCREADYIFVNGGVSALNGKSNGGVSSEKAGDYSVSYSGSSGMVTYRGIPFSPLAYDILRRKGYTNRLIKLGAGDE